MPGLRQILKITENINNAISLGEHPPRCLPDYILAITVIAAIVVDVALTIRVCLDGILCQLLSDILLELLKAAQSAVTGAGLGTIRFVSLIRTVTGAFRTVGSLRTLRTVAGL